MIFKKHKFPLLINIFWDNEHEGMYHVAQSLYEYFLRNTQKPLDRYLNIPVHRYTSSPYIETLDIENALYSANIFLVDEHMNMSNSWKEFSNQLNTFISSGRSARHKIYPIAFQKHVVRFNSKIQAYDVSKAGDRLKRLLLIYLTHNICRLIHGKDLRSLPKKSPPNPPITLYLSHAKKDGEKTAQALRQHINELPGLKSFFDTKDIPGGFDFETMLKHSIKESILVALHTDEYSSREWCRREVLLAKKYKRPVIVINRYQIGELRSFPYIGNVPHVRYPTDERELTKAMDYIVLEATREILRVRHHTLRVDLLCKYLNKEINTVMSYPPELISLLELKDKEKEVILYPDPPLGKEEISVLEAFCPHLEFTTPTLLPLISEDSKELITLDFKIAISLSETDKSDLAEIQNQDLVNLITELTKYLLVAGVKLIYNGKIDYEGKNSYSKLLIELVDTYRKIHQNTKQEKIKAIDNYSFYPLYNLLSKEERSTLQNLVNFIPVAPPEYLEVTPAKANKIAAFNSIDEKYVWAKSLTKMRSVMLQNANALIVIGGKSIGFKGKMPGILEETVIAFKGKQPIFIIGSYGGVSRVIIDALQGLRPDKLKISYFENNYPEYTYFLNEFNLNEWTELEEQVNLSDITDYLNNIGKASDFGLNNGLSREENERLFVSRNEIEIIYLILKGLKILHHKCGT